MRLTSTPLKFAVLCWPLDLFVASLVFMKGTSCCIIKMNFSRVEPLDRAMANFKRPWVCMISAVICKSLRRVWDLWNLPCVSVLFWLIYIARYVFRSPVICIWGTKYNVYCENVVYLHSILRRRARLWLELFASTVGRFLSRVSYLPSYV